MTASTATGWVKLGGYTLFPNDDVKAMFEGEPVSRAEKLVLQQPDRYGGFVTVDHDPVANPKYLCPIGLTLVWVGNPLGATPERAFKRLFVAREPLNASA